MRIVRVFFGRRHGCDTVWEASFEHSRVAILIKVTASSEADAFHRRRIDDSHWAPLSWERTQFAVTALRRCGRLTSHLSRGAQSRSRYVSLNSPPRPSRYDLQRTRGAGALLCRFSKESLRRVWQGFERTSRQRRLGKAALSTQAPRARPPSQRRSLRCESTTPPPAPAPPRIAL